MNGKYRFLLLFVSVLIIWKSFQYFQVFPADSNEYVEVGSDDVEKVKVSVYYEALCPDSKFFITHQLLPVFEELEDFLIMDLVPYGKAKTIEKDGKITFVCQHDAVECFANKIHACGLDFVKFSMLQVKYVACMITDNMIPEDAGERCAKELDIVFNPILDCANSLQGSLLLKAYGERTHALNPPVSFIPTIELNGSRTLVPQSAILKNLLDSVCQVFKRKPRRCG